MLPWIDALRGLAILMVLANHVALVVPGLSPPVLALARFGQMGVQLFFVASAYTLCLSWHQRRADESQPLLRFWLRRLFRIAPLYWLGVLLFTALHVLSTGRLEAGAQGGLAVLANLVFVHGFVPMAQNSVVPGGWSIGAEMAFYALFPVLMAATARWPGVGPAVLATLAALVLNLAWQAGRQVPVLNNSFGYFHLINQAPVFLLGVALFQWHRADRPPPAGHRLVAAVAGLAALGLTAWLWRHGGALAFAAVPTSAGLAFVALAHLARGLPARLPGLAALGAVGRVSYAVYIVHVLFAWHGLREVMAWLPLAGDAAYGLSLLGAGACSVATAHWLGRRVEQPAIALGRRLTDRWLAPSPARRVATLP